MKQRFWLIKHRGIFYLFDSTTKKRESLRTRSKKDAEKVLLVRRQAADQPSLNLTLGKAFLAAHDQQMPKRTWGAVMDEFCLRGKEATRMRNKRAVENKTLSVLRDKKIIETTADELLAVLSSGGVADGHFLRRLHNLALGLGWLPWPILQRNLWPKSKKKTKRGIALEEHQKIMAAERVAEWRIYYEILWEVGAAQTDGANLRAENIDWNSGVLSYQRQKSGEWAYLRIGERLATLLKQLPSSGLLFPKISPRNDSQRAWHFARTRKRAGVSDDVTLHSYRYGWAERGRACGYPERWAQNALGHRSKAVHQAYAKGGIAICPPMEEFERKVVNYPVVASIT